MPIKDLEKRKEYQRELMRKRRNEGLTENVSPDNLVRPNLVSPEKVVSLKNNSVSPLLDPNSNVSPQMLDQRLTVRPNEKMLDPVRPLENVSPCPRCPEIERRLKNTERTLDLVGNQKKEYFKQINQLEKELQQIDELTNKKRAISNLYDRLKIDFNNKVRSLLEIDKENEKLNQKIKELEKPINPTIELLKNRYSDLEKKSYQQANEKSETIKKLKERLRELYTKNQELEKHKEVKNSSQNQVSIPKEADVIPILLDKKHKKFIFYSCPGSCYEGKSCSNCSFFTQTQIKYEHIQ